MASIFTSNIYLEEPANGDYVGSWDVPVNANLSAIDLAAGQSVGVNLAAGSVTLATSQVRSATLIFTGNLIGNVTVTVPTISSGALISGRFWNVLNNCGNSSSFVVTMASTIAGSIVGVPPFESIGIFLEGSGAGVSAGALRHRGLGRAGSYWDYAGSSIPAWISACTVPPYLLCDGTAFSTAVYPALAIALNGGTLPDARGRYRASLNSGTGRITSGTSTGGVDGNTILATGGAQTTLLTSQNVPLVPIVLTDPTHTHSLITNYIGTYNGANADVTGGNTGGSFRSGVTSASATGITVTAGNAVPTNTTNLPPTYVGGLTFVRAA